MHKKKNLSNGILTEHIHVELSGILSKKTKTKTKCHLIIFPMCENGCPRFKLVLPGYIKNSGYEPK
jgi:hypothetical protein